MGEGLTRRRAGAGGSPTTTQSDQIPSSSNHNSSSSSGNGNKSVPTPSASGTGGRVAYDPRDFQDDAESNKMPRLTLMEEVLLLGLKDKAVRQQQPPSLSSFSPPISLASYSPAHQLSCAGLIR
jgi:Golgi phosphoprotein 3